LKPELWRHDSAASRRGRQEAEARAYARLLVSDIRLYHEEEVIVGRMEKDLGGRLGIAIEAARRRFLERHADAETFDTEVVRVLAGGDPSNLG